MLVGIYTNPERDVRLEVTKKLAGLLRREEVDFALHESLKDKLNDVTYFGNNDKPDVIIALGGDGTILSAVDFSAEKKIPVIGVNLGRLGFLSECTADRLEECVLRLKKGDYTLTERAMLETYVGEKRLLALNEIVFYKGNVGRTVTLSVNVGGSSLGKFKCDGYMVSTPTG
ncbi:MAG: NAD(+)/NADH kinase, partial [Clostridia bacterium]|nr:NAD(+)/NADH kinase [Clostridia bacterium]